MKKVILTLGSVTYAQKARKCLSASGIRSKAVKIDTSTAQDGCTHGIEIYEGDLLNAAMALRNSGISYSLLKEER